MRPNELEVIDGVGYFRLSGDWRFDQVVRAVAAAIAHAGSLGVKRMMLVTLEASGFESPSISDRHSMVRQWAQASSGPIRIAVVVPPTFIDPDRFGVVAAHNFGIEGDVFCSESEALAWLRDSV